MNYAKLEAFGILIGYGMHHRWPILYRRKVILLYDCDRGISYEEKGSFIRQCVPFQQENPVKTGVENLFPEQTLQVAKEHKAAFINISGNREDTVDGELFHVPAKWTVNDSEKTNLCSWLCENGTSEDFRHFEIVFEIIEALLAPSETLDDQSQR